MNENDNKDQKAKKKYISSTKTKQVFLQENKSILRGLLCYINLFFIEMLCLRWKDR